MNYCCRKIGLQLTCEWILVTRGRGFKRMSTLGEKDLTHAQDGVKAENFES